MEYDLEKVLTLLVNNKYLSPLNKEFLKRNPHLIRILPISLIALKENLTISLSSDHISPRNIRDFTSLLNAIVDITEKDILCVEIKHQGHRNIYIDNIIQKVFDEL